jgi:hypothetical protein
MRRLAALGLLLCGTAGLLRAADDPRTLVERAVRAGGGREALARSPATHSKVTGTIHFDGEGLKVDFKGDLYSEAGGRSRMDLDLEIGDSKHRSTVVLDGPRSWRAMDGEVEGFPAEEVQRVSESVHRDRVTALLPLLEDKGFTLAAAGSEVVGGRPADGVKVSYKGQPDVTLFFDRGSGLLVKYRYLGRNQGEDKPTVHEMVVSDYADVGVGPVEEKVLRGAGVDPAGPALLQLLRSHGHDPARLERVRALVRRLGDDSFEEREKAARELVAAGAAAVPLLRQAARDSDAEVARRAEECLRKIGRRDGSGPALPAAVRLAAARRIPGAAEALLNLLPADDESLGREVRAALHALAQGGAPDAALVKALTGGEPARRAAAAAALGKDGGAYLKEPGRRLYGPLPRHAMKMVGTNAGKREMSLTTQEVEAFNRFDDRLFVRP